MTCLTHTLNLAAVGIGNITIPLVLRQQYLQQAIQNKLDTKIEPEMEGIEP